MTFTLATWNINSVRLRMPLVERFLRSYQPDVLCLQETKCPQGQFPSAAIREAGYEHIAEFRGDARFSTWLTRIAINEALQVMRRDRRLESVDPALEPAFEEAGLRPRPAQRWCDDPESIYSRTECLALVERELAALPAVHRLPVVLRDMQGLSGEETAELLDQQAEGPEIRHQVVDRHHQEGLPAALLEAALHQCHPQQWAAFEVERPEGFVLQGRAQLGRARLGERALDELRLQPAPHPLPRLAPGEAEGGAQRPMASHQPA